MASQQKNRDDDGQLILVRHGQTPWSRSGRHTGVTDLALTSQGEAQARRVGEALRGRRFGMVLSSPLSRALRTAQLAGFGDDVQLDENLAEWDYGAYEGLTSAQITAERGAWDLWSDGVPAGNTPGETGAAVQRRVLRVIERAMPELDRGNDVLLFAHAHVLRALTVTWMRLPIVDGRTITLSPATVSVLGFEHDRPVIVRWNCPPDGPFAD